MTLLKVIPFVALLSLIAFVNAAHASPHYANNKKTTCYIFKNNKLQGKYSCRYSGEAGGDMTSAWSSYAITTPKNGRHSTEYFDDDGQVEVSLNRNWASFHVRNAKTLKIEPMASNKQLECYKDAQGFELCFFGLY